MRYLAVATSFLVVTLSVACSSSVPTSPSGPRPQPGDRRGVAVVRADTLVRIRVRRRDATPVGLWTRVRRADAWARAEHAVALRPARVDLDAQPQWRFRAVQPARDVPWRCARARMRPDPREGPCRCPRHGRGVERSAQRPSMTAGRGDPLTKIWPVSSPQNHGPRGQTEGLGHDGNASTEGTDSARRREDVEPRVAVAQRTCALVAVQRRSVSPALPVISSVSPLTRPVYSTPPAAKIS